MKRTGTRLKSKGIRSHVPNAYHAYSFYKFDRNYVAAHYGDVNHVPFNCGSRRAMRMFWDENPNVRLWGYLRRYMKKQVGRKMDDVFRDFSQLGWINSMEMYYYWVVFTKSRRHEYYTDDEGYLRFTPYRNKPWYYYDWDDWDNFDDDDDEEEEYNNEMFLQKYARKPSSEKRLVRWHRCKKSPQRPLCNSCSRQHPKEVGICVGR